MLDISGQIRRVISLSLTWIYLAKSLPPSPSIVRKSWKQTQTPSDGQTNQVWVIFFHKPTQSQWSKLKQEISKTEILLASVFRYLNIQLGCSWKCSMSNTLVWIQLEFNLWLWNDNLACSTSADPPCSTLERLLQYQVPNYPPMVIISTCIVF